MIIHFCTLFFFKMTIHILEPILSKLSNAANSIKPSKTVCILTILECSLFVGYKAESDDYIFDIVTIDVEEYSTILK